MYTYVPPFFGMGETFRNSNNNYYNFCNWPKLRLTALLIWLGDFFLQKISSKIFSCWFFVEKNPPVKLNGVLVIIKIIKIIKIDFFYVKYTVNFLRENLFENSVTTSNIFRFINFGDKHKCLYKKISNDQSFWISKKWVCLFPTILRP